MIPIKLNTLPGLESLPDAVTVRGNPHPVPFSPPIDPDHVFSVDVVRPILGWMLYDMDYCNAADPQPRFFRATLENGILNVPAWDSQEVRG